MTEQHRPAWPVVTITEEAANAIRAACERNGTPGNVVRFLSTLDGDRIVPAVQLNADTLPDDITYKQQDLTVAVSPDDVPNLEGSELDYEVDGGSGQFVLVTPNPRE